jgi:hypothetical protein
MRFRSATANRICESSRAPRLTMLRIANIAPSDHKSEERPFNLACSRGPHDSVAAANSSRFVTDPLSTVTKRLRAGIKPQTTVCHDFLIAAIRRSSLRCHRTTRLNVSAGYISGRHTTHSGGYRAIEPSSSSRMTGRASDLCVRGPCGRKVKRDGASAHRTDAKMPPEVRPAPEDDVMAPNDVPAHVMQAWSGARRGECCVTRLCDWRSEDRAVDFDVLE